ncbi:phosphoglycerate kinase [Candidatus Peribacteria bacterium RIFCSPHIGHO2_02_FULL_52_16]|nr:MAG: phosphoglycerate kinase [Candidatus Peribacteria bacterium RIFCSPHIGHO2_01_FULL_51_35]OGJ61643.1 MAG: phosphoglycerate kinase [Candidatus Peribacteria bacterium RIFCSPHIGHO2_02_FULL_52_16]
MSRYRTMDSSKMKGKRVIVRAGFDVPIEEGKVVDFERIEAVIPTMKVILDAEASLVVLSHQGRPKGKKDLAFTQKPLVPVLEKLLGRSVAFAPDVVGSETEKMAMSLKPGEVLLVENLRFEPGEEKNDPSLAKHLAALGDMYVNDAFTNSHRKHASMVELPKLLPSSAGLNLAHELEYLSKVHDDPRRPLVLIISGAKMETKIPIIEQFLSKGDDILLGGCVANTFIAARGFDVGKSKYEEAYVPKAQELMLLADNDGKANILVPRDAVVATEAIEGAEKIDLPVEDIVGDMAIFDIGKVTIERYIMVIEKAEMILWNGPLGFYEVNRFSHGTKRIAEAVAAATKRGAVTIVGGGDTIDFHRRYGYPLDAYTFVSTGGGAMLEYIAGKHLPALALLET